MAASYESRRVVIFDRLGVPEGFQDGVGLKQLLLQLPLVDTRRQDDTKYNKDDFPFVRQLASGEPRASGFRLRKTNFLFEVLQDDANILIDLQPSIS